MQQLYAYAPLGIYFFMPYLLSTSSLKFSLDQRKQKKEKEKLKKSLSCQIKTLLPLSQHMWFCVFLLIFVSIAFALDLLLPLKS